jgi:hypothetical protein
MVDFPRHTSSIPQRPEMFETWLQRFPNSDSGITGALSDMAKAYRALHVQLERIGADQLQTPGARIVNSAKWARTKLNPLFDRLATARKNAADHANQLEDQIKSAYCPKENNYEVVMLRQEIRFMLRNMPRTDQLRFLDEARRSGDYDALYAACSHNSYLAGMPPDVQTLYRGFLIEQKQPEAAANLKVLREQDALADQFEKTMLSSVGDLIDFVKADQLLATSSQDLADQYAS